MAYNDLREFIAKAEEIGEVKLVEGAHWEDDIGLIVELEALNPIARLPWKSIAALPIQRQVVSGW